MVESGLWHLVLIVGVWNASLIWGRAPKGIQPRPFDRSDLVYYPPEPTFPAVAGNQPQPRAHARGKGKSGGTPAIRVAAERGGGAVAPPALGLGANPRSGIPMGNPTLPAVPFAATTRSPALILPSDAMAVIAPPPEANQVAGNGRGRNLMQVTVVAPSPEVKGGGSGRRGAVGGFAAAAVGPAPSVEGQVHQLGGLDIGPSQVVAPSPQLPVHAQRTGSGVGGAGLGGGASMVVPPAPGTVERAGGFAAGSAASLPGNGLRAVPPAPSVQGAGRLAGAGNGPGSGAGTPLTGGNMTAVPPAPSLEASANGGGGGRIPSLGGSSLAVVPPTPSVEGAGRPLGGGRSLGSGPGGGLQAVAPAPSLQGGGGSLGGRDPGALSGTGLQAVAPAPSLDGAGGSVGGGSLGSLSGNGLQAVPPAPSLDGGGSSVGGGRGGTSLSAGGMGAVPPAPSGMGGGGNSRAGRSSAMDLQQAVAPPPAPAQQAESEEADNPPGAHDLPVRIIALALALPNTSYFSNYEVFIAERRLANNRSQLIKLVYQSLPYQKRLSEYDLNAKVYKLHVIRDRSCDETLLQMTWIDGSNANPQKFSTGAVASSQPDNDIKSKLPCYRTTADDYRKALTRAK